MTRTLDQSIVVMERVATTGGAAGKACGEVAVHLKQLRTMRPVLVVVSVFGLLNGIINICHIFGH